MDSLAYDFRWLDYMVSTLSTESLDFIKATNGGRGPMDYPCMDSLSMDITMDARRCFAGVHVGVLPVCTSAFSTVCTQSNTYV